MFRKRLLVGVLLAVVLQLVLSGCFFFRPTASFTVSPDPSSQKVYAGIDELRFIGSSSKDNVTYHWKFGDGETATGKSVKYTYGDNGDYTVRLEVIDSAGRMGCAEKELVIHNPGPFIGRMTVTDKDMCDGYPYSTCHRIHVKLEDVMDPAGLPINPKRVASATIDFGDGPDSVFSGFSATYPYPKAGTYTITGTVKDDDGAIDTETHTITIKSYDLVPPVVRLQPARTTANLNETIWFNIYAYDPDYPRDWCIDCPSPPPPSPPYPPPYVPCEGETIETKGISPRDAGIVRIWVTVFDAHDNLVALYDTDKGTLSLDNPTFPVKFYEPGTWRIEFMVKDDDCDCSRKAEGTRLIVVEDPDC